MRRRPKPSPHYSGRLPYSSSQPSSGRTSSLPARLPSLVVVSSFLLGWLTGRHEGARETGANAAARAKELGRSSAAGVLAFWGLAPRDECESAEGRMVNAGSCSVPHLMGRLMRERAALEGRMQSVKDYGPYYRQIFDDASTRPKLTDEKGRRPAERRGERTPLFLASPESTKRLSRRILAKHLLAASGEGSADSPPAFTWVTAGDATAAAHGNLYSQSYTEILRDTAGGAFESLGIRLVAKNYGMGGYSSGPELGMCMREVFGDDVDALMWDFASLQPMWEPERRSILWGYRAGSHPTRPILFSFDSFGDRFISMEKGGTGTILMDADAMQTLREKTPDSNVVKHLPDALRNYRCGTTLEGGAKCDDPMRNFVCYLDDEMMDEVGGDDGGSGAAEKCKADKFRTKPECIDARYQVSWQPGWKDHMLKGRLIGHFLINALEDALFELDELKSEHGDDPRTLLAHLESLELRDGRSFWGAQPDTKAWDEDGAVSEEMGAATVLRGESICHTALLPSMSRLEGITTENESGVFDKGESQFLMNPPEDGRLPLAYDMNDRQLCESLEVDHKDFFLVREQDGWVSTVVPNDTELAVYRRSTPVEGIIVLCMKICPLNKCPDAYISISEVSRRRRLFATVDGKPVTGVRKLDSCHILAGDDGIRWGKKEQFELRFRINDPGTLRVLKISSIIVF